MDRCDPRKKAQAAHCSSPEAVIARLIELMCTYSDDDANACMSNVIAEVLSRLAGSRNPKVA